VLLAGLLYFLWSNWDSDALATWKREASPLLFFAAQAILPVFGAPVTPFFVFAGTTFGVRIGLAGTMVALAINLTVCYLIGQSGLRTVLGRLLRRLGYELPDFKAGREGALRFALAVKLAPALPAPVKNYVLGMVGVPFGLYFGLSMLFTGAYAAVLVVLGESLIEHDLGRSAAIAGVFLTIAVGTWWWQRRRALARKTEEPAGPPDLHSARKGYKRHP
jgi:uncharacterized membrane protein YdjX (TVP38/TMEM64 family)